MEMQPELPEKQPHKLHKASHNFRVADAAPRSLFLLPFPHVEESLTFRMLKAEQNKSWQIICKFYEAAQKLLQEAT